MRKFVWGITTLALGVGLGMGGNVTASAASGAYSARRSNSVRLVWRKTMRQHAYTTTTGVRYSKHLGMRYSNAALGGPTQSGSPMAMRSFITRSRVRRLFITTSRPAMVRPTGGSGGDI